MDQTPRYMRDRGVPLKQKGCVWWEDYAQLWDEQADILVTHEAPSCHRHGFAVLDDMAEAMSVRRVIHGHHHESYQAAVKQGIHVQGVARCGIIDQNGRQLFGGLDRRRNTL